MPDKQTCTGLMRATLAAAALGLAGTACEGEHTPLNPETEPPPRPPVEEEPTLPGREDTEYPEDSVKAPKLLDKRYPNPEHRDPDAPAPRTDTAEKDEMPAEDRAPAAEQEQPPLPD